MALVRYWDGAPPVNETFAAFIGHKRQLPAIDGPSVDPIDALIQDFQGLG